MDYYHIAIIILEIIFFITIVLLSVEKINRNQTERVFIILIILTLFTPFLKLLK